MVFNVINKTKSSVGEYALAELTKLLDKYDLPAEANIVLETRKDAEHCSYGVQFEGDTVTLWGHSESDVLQAVYLFLRQIGFVFDTKTHFPADVDLSCIKSETVHPFVRLRGIRQHINFPMDISSYSLKDAEEYIYSLPRMGYNAITFHSYDGMWHKGPGHFFYGRTHMIPEVLADKGVIDNKKYYVIPECEPLYANGDTDAVAGFAVKWLASVMSAAKNCGMHVTLSIEPPEDAATVKEALSFYPEIDCLELISPEGGDADEALRRSIELLKEIDEVPVRVGMYILDRKALYDIKRKMDAELPTDMIRTFLPAHGAEAVLMVTKDTQFEPSDFQKTVLHSWAEFDGSMYISQNACNALGRTLLWLKDFTGAPSIYGMYLNHWRTEENRLALAFGARAMVSPLNAVEWYAEYAECFNINGKKISDIMYKAGETDIFCRDYLFNIGFCFIPCWTNHFGINWIRGWTAENVAKAREEYIETVNGLRELAADAAGEGLSMLSFLINRYEATLIHFDVIDSMNMIRDSEERANVETALTKASEYISEYIEKTCEMLPDRGAQGLVVSYACEMNEYLRHLKKCYLGEEGNAADTDDSGTVAPPPPPV